MWALTPAGRIAAKKHPMQLWESIQRGYVAWKAGQSKDSDVGMQVSMIETTDVPEEEVTAEARIGQLEEAAFNEIRRFIADKSPYEFQELVAALLRVLGYFTPFIAPKGPDGGIDIIAYRDPLGAETPRIKVQVKHRPAHSIAVDEIRSLRGLLNSESEIGLFVTSGRFTSEAERLARDSGAFVRLIDIHDLVNIWKEHYPNLPDDEKLHLPLHSVMMLGGG